MGRLIELGGEGEWMAVVYADSNPLGKAEFMVGEEKADTAEISRYTIVAEDESAIPDLATDTQSSGDITDTTESIQPATSMDLNEPEIQPVINAESN